MGFIYLGPTTEGCDWRHWATTAGQASQTDPTRGDGWGGSDEPRTLRRAPKRLEVRRCHAQPVEPCCESPPRIEMARKMHPGMVPSGACTAGVYGVVGLDGWMIPWDRGELGRGRKHVMPPMVVLGRPCSFFFIASPPQLRNAMAREINTLKT